MHNLNLNSNQIRKRNQPQPNFVDTNTRDGTKSEGVHKRLYQAIFSGVNLGEPIRAERSAFINANQMD